MGEAHAERATWKGRRSRRCRLVLAAALARPACATGAGFQARMVGLVGAAEADLVAAPGVPTGARETGGRRW